MNDITYTSPLDLLVAAGFDFEVVDHCPQPDCGLCTQATMLAEAA